MTRPIRVLCVDDHAVLIAGLRARFEIEEDIAFVGSLETAEDLADHIVEMVPDVVLLDIDMPGPDPFAELTKATERKLDARVVMLSAYVKDHYIDRAFLAGAWGYLSKGDDPDTLVAAIRSVAKGQVAFGPEVHQRSRVVTDPKSDRPRAESKLDVLTPREMEILKLIGQGLSRGEIAAAIFRSPKTVDVHRASIMDKLGIHDRVELARFAIREGVAEA